MKQLQNKDFNHSIKDFSLFKQTLFIIQHLIGSVHLSPKDKNYLNTQKIMSYLNSYKLLSIITC